MGFLAPHADKIYAAFRIMTGLMFMQHGFQKLLGWFGGPQAGAPAWIVYGAGSIEFVGGFLVAAGLFAAPAAFIASGMMAVAFLFHTFVLAKPPSVLPILNGGELAALYSWTLLLIASKGSGIWSVDAARGAK